MRVSVAVVLIVALLMISAPALAEPDAELEQLRLRVEAYRLYRESFAALQQAERAVVGDGILLDIEPPDDDEKALFRRAIDLAKQALALVPEFPDPHLVIANAYWALDRLDLTDRHYSMLLDLDPARDDVLSARAGLRIERKDWQGAEADVERLSELGSEFAERAAKELESAKQAHQVDE